MSAAQRKEAFATVLAAARRYAMRLACTCAEPSGMQDECIKRGCKAKAEREAILTAIVKVKGSRQ